MPKRKKAKWPPWRHRFRIFKIWEKWTLQISVRSYVENFIKIDPSVWAGELPHTHIHTHTHTDAHTHTHTHTHTLGSIATYSVKMTEYKKGKKKILSESSECWWRTSQNQEEEKEAGRSQVGGRLFIFLECKSSKSFIWQGRPGGRLLDFQRQTWQVNDESKILAGWTLRPEKY